LNKGGPVKSNIPVLILGSINAATAVIVFPYTGIPWPESILQDSK